MRTETSGEERANAFTLTELVLVVGVIALMAGVLLPAYAISGRKAGIVECKNNLRQVGAAIDAFARDHTNSLPGPLWVGCFPTYQGGASPTINFMGYYLAPYFGLPAADGTLRRVPALDCPASVQAQRYPNLQGTGGSLDFPISYTSCRTVTNRPGIYTDYPFGFPSVIGPTASPIAVTGIRRPSEQWAITDIDGNNFQGGATYAPYLPTAPVHNNRPGGPRQMARRNYLYFDWSVRSVETPQ